MTEAFKMLRVSEHGEFYINTPNVTCPLGADFLTVETQSLLCEPIGYYSSL